MTTANISMDENEPYNSLIAEMPRIAKNVNAFESESVQKAAFDALVAALGAPVAPVLHTIENKDANKEMETAEKASNDDDSRGKRRRGRSSSTRRSFSPTKGLNFAPDGRPNLAAFVSEKAARNQHERNLVACYYLKEVMGVEKVDANHVLAVYRAAGWNAASRPDTSLQKTASAHGWLDTSDMSDIKLMWLGIDHLEMKMPVETKKDAA